MDLREYPNFMWLRVPPSEPLHLTGGSLYHRMFGLEFPDDDRAWSARPLMLEMDENSHNFQSVLKRLKNLRLTSETMWRKHVEDLEALMTFHNEYTTDALDPDTMIVACYYTQLRLLRSLQLGVFRDLNICPLGTCGERETWDWLRLFGETGSKYPVDVSDQLITVSLCQRYGRQSFFLKVPTPRPSLPLHVKDRHSFWYRNAEQYLVEHTEIGPDSEGGVTLKPGLNSRLYLYAISMLQVRVFRDCLIHGTIIPPDYRKLLASFQPTLQP